MTKNLNNTSISRIYKLIILQIGHIIRDIKNKNKKKLIFKIFLLTLLFLAITIGLSFLVNFIKNYFSFKFDENFFISILFLTQIIGIISNLDNISNVLYISKENIILLAYPCNYNEIFISKIIIFIIDEFKKSIFFLLPFLIGYGAACEVPIAYWILLIPFWIILCIFPVLISSCLSIPANAFKRFLQNHLFIYSVLIITIYILLFIIAIYARNNFNEMLRTLNSNNAPTLRLVAIYSKILTWLDQVVIVKINKFALWYNFIGSAMFGNKTLIYSLISLLIFVLWITLCFLFAMPFYFKSVSLSMENSNVKKHKAKKDKKHSLLITFLKKEEMILFRTSSELKSAINVIFLFPLIVFAMNTVLSTINTNTLGNHLIIAFNIMITLSLLGTHNSTCAMSISKEGSEFQVLKASPSNSMIITWAKCIVNTIVNLLSLIILTIVLFYTTKLPYLELILISVVIFFVSLGQIFWSFIFDLTNPKLNDYAIKGDAVTDNINVARAMIMAFIIATLFGFLTILLLRDDYTSGWIRLIIISIAFFSSMIYLFTRYLKEYFDEIQM